MTQKFPFDHFLKIGNNQSDKSLIINQVNSLNNNDIATSSNFHNEELDNINEEVLNSLRNIVPELKFQTYFENNLMLTDIGSDSVEFSVKTNFIKKTVELYKDDISKSLNNVLGKMYNINLTVKESSKEDIVQKSDDQKIKSVNDVKFTLDLTPSKNDLQSKATAQYIEHMNPTHTGLLIDKNKTFDNFIVGPTNNVTWAATKAVAEIPGKNGKYQSLYIHSNPGLGKTHLLHAVANEIAIRYPSYNICLITARDFMQDMIELMKKNKINEFVKKYTEKVDVLMIDDIHELKNKEATQDQFFHVFNEMHNKGKQLIFTSDKNPKEIDGIHERIISRLQGGLVVNIQPPDLETRIAILKRKMESLDIIITEDVLTLIASKIKTNIRELEGSLIRLKAVSELLNVEIEIDLVKEQLNFQNTGDEKQISIESVTKATAQYYRVPIADLKSKGRGQEITRARHVAMYLAKKIVNGKYQEIGTFFGNRDHSSVIHAVTKVTDEMKTDSALSRDINAIEANL